jgi:hypothetical protein
MQIASAIRMWDTEGRGEPRPLLTSRSLMSLALRQAGLLGLAPPFEHIEDFLQRAVTLSRVI